MRSHQWFKSSEILVLRQSTADGLRFVNRRTKNYFDLDEQWVRVWEAWDPGDSNESLPEHLASQLAATGIIYKGESLPPMVVSEIDAAVLTLSTSVKWYSESTGMCVLFNTDCFQVLVLSPYASLLWKRIVAGYCVGDIRSKARRFFGRDDALTLLKVLVDLAFLQPIDHLEKSAPSQYDHVWRDFCAPRIEFWLPHSLIPWSCDWELNTICNLRCRHCYLPHHTGSGPSPEAATTISNEIIAAGIPFVNLLGGEVLLRKDLERIIRRLRNAGLFVTVISNGVLLTEERGRSLAKAGVNRIMFSLDGLTKEMHESCRGEGTFMETLRGIEHAKLARIPHIAVIWTVQSNNVVELERLPSLLSQLDISECCVDLFKKTGNLGEGAPYEPLVAGMVTEISDAIAGWRQAHPHLSIVFEPECTCGRTRVTIGANGDVRLCTLQDTAAGNLRERQLMGIWRSMTAGYKRRGALGYCATHPRH